MFEPKILVEIIGKTLTKKRKLIVEGNHVVVSKGSRGRGGAAYRPTFKESSKVTYKTGIWPFKRLKQKLILVEGADECISFNPEDHSAEVPFYDRKALKRAFDAESLKHGGQSLQQLKIPTAFYILLFAIIFLIVLNILFSSGRVMIV